MGKPDATVKAKLQFGNAPVEHDRLQVRAALEEEDRAAVGLYRGSAGDQRRGSTATAQPAADVPTQWAHTFPTT